MKKLLGVLLGIGLVCFAQALFAVRMNGLYESVQPVTSQSVEERNQMIPKALGIVLVKVSGNKTILTNPVIHSALKKADTLVQEFSYGPSSDLTKPFLLKISFDQNAIDKLLQEANAPLWGETRPLILMLLEYEAPGYAAQVLSDDTVNSITSSLKQQAQQRGLPIVFPAMDVTDINQIMVNDIVMLSPNAFDNSVKRYASDGILLGRIIQTTVGFDTRWKLIVEGQEWDWNTTGKTVADILPTVIDYMSNALSTRYAVVETHKVTSEVTLKITGVNAADDFAEIMRYLKTLPVVADIQPIQVSGSDLLLQVSIQGTPEALAEAVLVGQKLTAEPSEGAVLVYQWNH